MKTNSLKVILTAAGVLAAGVCYIGSRGGITGSGEAVFLAGETAESPEPEAFQADGLMQEGDSPSQEAHIPAAQPEAPETGEASITDSSEEERIYVHVCGQVVSPGVYEMTEGSRVYEAIEMAGGCSEEAAADWLNMAQIVTDGMKIQVPDKEEAALLAERSGPLPGISGGEGGQALSEGSSGQKVNLNTAGKEELMTLTGIGEARAEDIIRYREESGGFQKIEDIMNVSGIKEAAFQKIKEDITV